MTVSFHKYRKYFPGTGDLTDIGAENGKYYSVNVPLKDGIDDDSYLSIIKLVMNKVMQMFQPRAIVIQYGAYSLSGYRLGCFNLTLKGHEKCVELLKMWNQPILLQGGVGYTTKNMACCWTYESAVVLGEELANQLPYNDYFKFHGPDFQLHISHSNMTNKNIPKYLDKIKMHVFENLRMLPHAPGVQMQAIPEDGIKNESDDEEEGNPYQGISIRDSVKLAKGTGHRNHSCFKPGPQIAQADEEKGKQNAKEGQKEMTKELLDFCENATTADDSILKPNKSAAKKTEGGDRKASAKKKM
ncbi:hypothetical protein ACJMK2_033351 [Sinanodonta woodiana]|uniref:Histone deacetylase domain-containing protein n=1 Tax=Sinanodonta woodiana TaxID=1069815 RepID=A0ABD3WQ75_SINWO